MIEQLAVPARAVGGFVEMSLETFRAVFRRPFQFREFLDQTWMIARVSLVPTLLVAIPFTVLVAFTLNILLREIGAADLSGAGTAFGTITQLGPVVTVLVVAGAGATAICADLGARTIREEIDAMRVLGIDPIQRLVVPRVLASTFVALLLNGLVSAIGIAGGYVFSVLLQGVNPGAFVNGLTVLTHLGELVLSEIKALLFGVVAGLVGCYRGLTVKGGPKGVGVAVNETVVYAFICLFVINVIMTAIGVRVLGIDQIQRLVVPRVLASTFVALLLNGLVSAIGIAGGYVFSVLLQGVNPGAFINGLTVLTGLRELVLAEVKALLFGVMAGLVGCYRGLTVKGGPKGVGNAVNETVVYAFICLFVINVIMTAIGVRVLAR